MRLFTLKKVTSLVLASDPKVKPCWLLNEHQVGMMACHPSKVSKMSTTVCRGAQHQQHSRVSKKNDSSLAAKLPYANTD